MSNLWREASGAGWEPMPPGALEHDNPSVRLVRFGTGADSGVALLARPGVTVRVNGLPIAGGMRVLQHRDELLVARRRYFFSAESTPVVTVFQLAEGDRRPACPICRGPIRDGEQIVRCPGCGRSFHQLGGEGKRKTCWTYAAHCRFCRHPTALDGATAWRPEQEEAHE